MSARFWDSAAEKYDKGTIADPAGYERTLDRTLNLLQPDHRVAELGCGTGTTALRLASRVQAYLATDISPNMIAMALAKYSATPVAGLAFRMATVETLAPDAERFDAVLGFNYLHLVGDASDTLHRIHDLLVPGGLFVSKTPCLGDMTPLVRAVLLPVMRAFGQAPRAHVFRSAELVQAIRSAGFDIATVENHASNGNDNRPYVVARKQ